MLGKESLGNGNLSEAFNTQRSDTFPSQEASLHQAKSTDLCLFDGRLVLESILLPVLSILIVEVVVTFESF